MAATLLRQSSCFLLFLCSAFPTSQLVFFNGIAASVEARAGWGSPRLCVRPSLVLKLPESVSTGNQKRLRSPCWFSTVSRQLGFDGVWKGKSESLHHMVWMRFSKSKAKPSQTWPKSFLALAPECPSGKSPKPLPGCLMSWPVFVVTILSVFALLPWEITLWCWHGQKETDARRPRQGLDLARYLSHSAVRRLGWRACWAGLSAGVSGLELKFLKLPNWELTNFL